MANVCEHASQLDLCNVEEGEWTLACPQKTPLHIQRVKVDGGCRINIRHVDGTEAQGFTCRPEDVNETTMRGLRQLHVCKCK